MEKNSEVVKFFPSSNSTKRLSIPVSHLLTRGVPDDAPLTNALLAQHLAFRMATDTHRSLKSDNEHTQVSFRPKSRPKSCLSARSHSAEPHSAYRQKIEMRTWVKESFEKAKVKAISTVKLEGFYKSLCHIRKEENDMRRKINSLQNSSEVGNSHLWNYPEKRTLRKSFESAVTISMQKQATKLANEEFGMKRSSSVASVEMSPLLLTLVKESRMPSRESTLTNFFRDTSSSKKRRSRQSTTDECFSAFSSTMKENPAKQSTYSAISELLAENNNLNGENDEKLLLTRLEDIPCLNRNHLKSRSSNNKRREHTIQTREKEEEILASNTNSVAVPSSHKTSLDLIDLGPDEYAAEVHNRQLHRRKVSTPQPQPELRSETWTPSHTMPKRPSSGVKKRVKAIPYTKISVFPEETGNGRKALKINRIGPDVARTKQSNPNVNQDNKERVFQLIMPNNNNQKPQMDITLKIQGQKYRDECNPTLIEKVYNSLNARNLKSAEGFRGQQQQEYSHRENLTEMTERGENVGKDRASSMNTTRKSQKNVLESWVTRRESDAMMTNNKVIANRLSV